MPILAQMIEMYRAQGIDICTGLSSHDFGDLGTAPFTRFIKDGRAVTNGLGIAMQEIYFLEHLFSVFQPRRILIIGNSQGWSTLAIALLLPNSVVAAMDAGFDENSVQGLDLTRRIAAATGLRKVRIFKAASPQDVASVVDSALEGSVDFAFIDGLHSNKQIVLDFQAIAARAAESTIYLFHDVHAHYLYDGIRKIASLAGPKYAALPLRATPSGMVILYHSTRHPEIARIASAFAPTIEARSTVRREALRLGFRRRLKRKLRRNLAFMKCVNVVCRLSGIEPYSLAQEL